MPLPRPQAFLTALTLTAVLLTGSACRDRQERARAELQSAAFSFTVGDFLKAAGAGHLSVVAFFLDAGMNPDVALADGRTALMAAAAAGQGDTVKLLLIKGAKVTATGPDGLTPLLAAVRGGDERSVSALLQAGADPARPGSDGATPLTVAALLGHAVLAGILVPVSKTPPDPAFRLACGKGHTAVMDVLLNAGADINLPGEENRTPLMLAAMTGQLPAVKLLCHRQARLSPRDAGGLTATALARNAGHRAVASFLEEWTARHAGDDPEASFPPAFAAGPADPSSPSPAPGADSPAAAPDGNAATAGAEPGPSPPVPEAATGAAAFSPPDPAAPAPEIRPVTAARFPRLSCDSVHDVPNLMRMTAYQLRPWPFLLWDVDRGNEAADVELTGEGNRKVNVRVGAAIPGTGCTVEKVRRRRVPDDKKPGKLVNASELIFRCGRTGEVFRAAPGIRVLSSDSSALLRITGSRTVWTATAGDTFRLGSTLLKITAIEPRAVVLENLLTHESVRLDLSPPASPPAASPPPAKPSAAPARASGAAPGVK